jgi:hypothetical protein
MSMIYVFSAETTKNLKHSQELFQLSRSDLLFLKLISIFLLKVFCEKINFGVIGPKCTLHYITFLKLVLFMWFIKYATV